MEYPEIHDPEEFEELNQLIEPVEKFFNEGSECHGTCVACVRKQRK